MASVLIKIQRSVVLTVIWKTSSQILDNIYSHNCWHGRCWELWWSPTTWPITIFNLGKEKTTTTKNPTYSEKVFLNLAVDSLETAAEELKHFFARFEVSHPSQSPYQKREEEKKKKMQPATCLYDQPVVLTLVLKCIERLVWIICPSSLPHLIRFPAWHIWVPCSSYCTPTTVLPHSSQYHHCQICRRQHCDVISSRGDSA